MTYTADDNIATLTAYNNADGSTQVTDYTYGTTTPSSTIVRNDLLAEVEYPDSGTVLYTYNAQGQQLTKTDQNGTVHNYSYDFLGRLTEDTVSTFGIGVDTTIATIQQAYEVRGYLQTVTSLDGSSTVINQVQMNYNGFGQLFEDYQEHNGAVTGGSMVVAYTYVPGTSNTTRRTQMTYPSGYNLNYLYNSGSADDYLSRVSSLLDTDDTTHLADYTYLGASDIVEVDYSGEAAINYNLGSNTGAADPYTGGFDQFDRVILDLWQPDSGGGSPLVKLGYIYDLAGNRLTRADMVARMQSPPQNFDEAYVYDGLYRLIDFQRGQLSGGAIDPTTLNYRQNWQTAPLGSSSSSSSGSGAPSSVQLDSLGNWLAFNQDTSGSGFSLTQTRTHNTSNEITSITGGSWTTPAYDAAGNTTSFPQVTDPTSGATATYDAWNRLVSLSTGSTLTYDGLNRIAQYTAGGLTLDVYYSDQWQILELWLAGMPAVINQRFVWGLRYVDDMVLRDRSLSGDGTLDERIYSMQDAHWSVVALFDPSAPGIVQRHTFDAYGNPFFLNPDFSDGSNLYNWNFLYSGYLWDTNAGLYYVRNRVYHAPLGRWLQRDPIDYDAGDMNLYGYVDGRPTKKSDPSGMAGSAPQGDAAMPYYPVNADCEYACGLAQRNRNNQNPPFQGMNPGVVVCFAGTMCACFLNRQKEEPHASKCLEYLKCVMDHEKNHLTQRVPCDKKSTKVYMPNWKDPSQEPAIECRERKASIPCVEAVLAKIGNGTAGPGCKEARATIEEDLSSLRKYVEESCKPKKPC